MPGYYDWKLRNCSQGAAAKAESFIHTLDQVEEHLHVEWDANKGSFGAETKNRLQKIVDRLDEAEDRLEQAKLELAGFFPGRP